MRQSRGCGLAGRPILPAAAGPGWFPVHRYARSSRKTILRFSNLRPAPLAPQSRKLVEKDLSADAVEQGQQEESGMVREDGLLVYRTGRPLPAPVVDDAIRRSREERARHLPSSFRAGVLCGLSASRIQREVFPQPTKTTSGPFAPWARSMPFSLVFPFGIPDHRLRCRVRRPYKRSAP